MITLEVAADYDTIASRQSCPHCAQPPSRHVTRVTRGVVLATYVCPNGVECPGKGVWDAKWLEAAA